MKKGFSGKLLQMKFMQRAVEKKTLEERVDKQEEELVGVGLAGSYARMGLVWRVLR